MCAKCLRPGPLTPIRRAGAIVLLCVTCLSVQTIHVPVNGPPPPTAQVQSLSSGSTWELPPHLADYLASVEGPKLPRFAQASDTVLRFPS